MRKRSVSLSIFSCTIAIAGALVALLSLSFTHVTETRAAASRLNASLTPHIIRSNGSVKLAGVDLNLSSSSILPCIGLAHPPLCYSPQQMRRAYAIQPLLDQGFTGKGHTIVLVDDYQSPTIGSDLKLFDRIFGLNDPKLNIIAPQGLKPFDPSDSNAISFADEISLDVEWSHALAPDATIDLVLGKPTDSSLSKQIDALIQATTYATNKNLGSVISLSVGVGETCYSPAEIQHWHQAFVTAQQKHISVLVSSGDSGAAVVECDKAGNFIQDIQGVNYPASDPLVTSVGGTTLLANGSGQYEHETVWDDAQNGVGSGGGFSSIFTTPNYQQNVPGIGAYRAIPDVAYNADPNTGVPVVTTSSTGYTQIVPFGGTSAGAPQWAAIITLDEQAIGHSIGFLNPYVYQLARSQGYSKAFHDITKGNNTVIGVDSNYNPITIQGYDASAGWDASTGWGSCQADQLAQLLKPRT